jgi:HEAT repeat protein
MPRIIVAMLAALTLSTAAAAQTPPTQASATEEPVVRDRKLSEWIADLKALAPYNRNMAAYEIATLGPAAAPAVPALVEALQDQEASVRYPVTVALREIGPAAKAAVPALKKVYEEDLNDEVASSARRAIKAIAPNEAPRD